VELNFGARNVQTPVVLFTGLAVLALELNQRAREAP
jgi:hypothetical protein